MAANNKSVEDILSRLDGKITNPALIVAYNAEQQKSFQAAQQRKVEGERKQRSEEEQKRNSDAGRQLGLIPSSEPDNDSAEEEQVTPFMPTKAFVDGKVKEFQKFFEQYCICGGTGMCALCTDGGIEEFSISISEYNFGGIKGYSLALHLHQDMAVAEVLADFIKKLGNEPWIKGLRLNHNKIDDNIISPELFKPFIRALEENSTIEDLFVNSIPYLNVVAKLNSKKSLKGLSVTGQTFPFEDLPDFIERHPSLEKLRFFSCTIRLNDMEILDALSKSKLNSLIFDNSSFSNRTCCLAFVTYLQQTKTLRKLSVFHQFRLENRRNYSSHNCDFKLGLSQVKNLTELHIRERLDELTVEELNHIKNAITNNTNLTTLSLGIHYRSPSREENKLMSENLVILFDHIKKHPSLKHFKLLGLFRPGNDDVRELIEAQVVSLIQTNVTLKTLTLGQNLFNAEAMFEILRATMHNSTLHILTIYEQFYCFKMENVAKIKSLLKYQTSLKLDVMALPQNDVSRFYDKDEESYQRLNEIQRFLDENRRANQIEIIDTLSPFLRDEIGIVLSYLSSHNVEKRSDKLTESSTLIQGGIPTILNAFPLSLSTASNSSISSSSPYSIDILQQTRPHLRNACLGLNRIP